MQPTNLNPLTDRTMFWWRKPLRGKPRWIWLIIVALILCAAVCLGCSPRSALVPDPVKEPVTKDKLQPPKPQNYFSQRGRAIWKGG